MADHKITSAQLGVYEIPLEAGIVTTVETDGRDFFNVLAHSGAAPVYARFADTVAPKDQTAVIIPTGTYATVRGSGDTVAIVSESSAVVSVVRASA